MKTTPSIGVSVLDLIEQYLKAHRALAKQGPLRRKP